MEATGEAKIGSLLDKIQPPRLEDAGLEDCALPPDSIQEAFLKAATAVRSRIFHSSDDDESEEDCVNDPWPGSSGGDKLVDGKAVDPPGACAPKKGGELPEAEDVVVTGGGEGMTDKVLVGSEVAVDGGGKSCVDGLRGLEIGEKKGDGEIEGKKRESNKEEEEEDEDDEKIPVLVEACI